MALGTMEIVGNPSSEWVVEASNVDNIDVYRGREGRLPLALNYERRFGQENIDWRVVHEPLEHNLAGNLAKTLGMYPVRVEATVTAIKRDKDRIHGVSRKDFELGLEKIMG